MDEDIGLVKAPRICKMIRDESGYGFNLHGEKGVIGQYISAIDTDGAAEKSGLRVGDRVVEVNGINVEAMSHGEVVHHIRGDPNEAILLVIDKITDNYLKKINRPVTASLASYSSVHEITIEEAEKLKELRLNDDDIVDGDEAEEEEEKYFELETSPVPERSPTPPHAREPSPPPVRERSPPPVREPSPPPAREPTPPPAREPTPPPAREPTPPPARQPTPPPAREPTPPPAREPTPPPVREPTPPPAREPTPPPAREPTPPPVREPTPPPADQPTSLPNREIAPPISNGSPKRVSKKDALKKIMGKPPKRKEVKEKQTDWKTKLSEFNNM